MRLRRTLEKLNLRMRNLKIKCMTFKPNGKSAKVCESTLAWMAKLKEVITKVGARN
jgi:hypothetical protein